MKFKLIKNDLRSNARAGVLKCSIGEINTPIFMPVGTQASVKGIDQIILKEQDNYCRGPGRYECEYYECDMRVNNKRFSDKKSVLPQYDHIILWKEGGNSIQNLQALCPNCHWMKTRMESLINEDEKSINMPRIKGIYESLTKNKGRKIEEKEDSSSSDEDEFCVSGRRRRNIYYYSTLKPKLY